MSNIVQVNNSNILPSPTDYNMIKEIAVMGFASGLLPTSIKNKEQAIIIALKGRELGIPPMQAFAHINVISGKPTMSSELMLAQIYKCIPTASISYIENSSTSCIIEAQRPHSKVCRFSFTTDDAQKAGLLVKDTWKKYPDAMLRARAISAMARAMFADALMGVSYTPEELGLEVEFDDNGNETIKDVTPKTEEKPAHKKEEQPKTIVNHAPQSKEESDKQIADKKEQPKKEPITHKNFIFQNPPEFKGKRFDEVEFAELSGYMDALAFKYLNQDIPTNVQWFFDLYNAYIKEVNAQ